MPTRPIQIGIVGSAGRGGGFKLACDALDDLHIHAVCDLNADQLEESRDRLGAAVALTDYDKMLDTADVDAVILGTPMPFHVPQAVAALSRGIHVLSEVPAGVSVEECRDLTRAAHDSSATYMMAENYTYSRPNQIVREMVRRGAFGDVYYAEGEYIHELKGLNEITTWRRKWQTGINGITYGTHSLGPITQWFAGDRVTQVCCAGSGHHYKDPRGDLYENEESCVMLCRFRSGGLAKIRVDMLSDRPHSMSNYQLQGTDGCYESARQPGQPNFVWLRSLDADAAKWFDLDHVGNEFIPESWVKYEQLAQQAGHGGGDLIELIDFADAIRNRRPTPVGIHEAMDMTLPGLISQRSISEAGRWIDVPDSRDWID